MSDGPVLTESPKTREVVKEIKRRLMNSGHSERQADRLARNTARRAESGESTVRKKD